MNNQVLITALISGGAAIIVGLFTYLGMRAKNKADAAKSNQDAAGKREENADRIIARWEKDNKILEDKLALKEIIIDNLNKRLSEKEVIEKTYLTKIQQLEIKIDELSNKVNQLTVTMSQKIH